MNGQMITYSSNGASASGYLSLPREAGPGVVVIQEWWGLVPHIKGIADRFAAAGFIALAPDLYHGQATKSPDEAGKLMMAMNVERAEEDLSGAVSYLKNHAKNATQKVGAVGFCMGGALSLFAASRNRDVAAAVVFYGGHPNIRPDLAALQAPILGLYAEKDAHVTPESVRQLQSKLTELGKEHEIHIYPGADHGFFNDERPEVYNKAAAEDAWNRTLAFFRRHLS
jgi:carboxymethylenebutenolidase